MTFKIHIYAKGFKFSRIPTVIKSARFYRTTLLKHRAQAAQMCTLKLVIIIQFLRGLGTNFYSKFHS